MKLRACHLSVLALVAVALMAHGNYEHIMGTVVAAKPDSITVRTARNTTVEVLLDAKTTFSRADQPATPADLKAGDRVVIHATKANGRFLAHTVKLGVAGDHKN